MNERHLTLIELNRLVRQTVELGMPDEYWVEAELSECRESRGHCYMELIQKEEGTQTPVARASARCWASKWMMIGPHFERLTGQRIHAGMKLLLRVYPQFHEAYGFAWIVTDIDPNYTLGDMVRKRQDIIRRLKEEGVFDLQRELRLPLFCQRIAVISSQTAAGYGDFAAQLRDNPYDLHFETQLFQAIMQGEGVEQSIVAALEQIYNAQFAAHDTQQQGAFDCVVIIRGGGATSDLSGFDTLALAENVANFPLPIITGIGHDRDESVIDMVSHIRVKTPTAAAALLIERLKRTADAIDDAQERIAQLTQQRITVNTERLNALAERLPLLAQRRITVNAEQLNALAQRLPLLAQQRITVSTERLNALAQRLPLVAQRRIETERHRLELMSEKAKALDPERMLRRGYSITLHEGHAVTDASRLQPGAVIETRLAKGTLQSTVTK